MTRINRHHEPPIFGYKSPVKRIAKHCAYTGVEFTKENKPTFEHILPHSKKGKGDISNCLATLLKPNQQRGNKDFTVWLKKRPEVAKYIQNYLNELRGLMIRNKNYVELVKKTLNKQAKGLVIFRGKG